MDSESSSHPGRVVARLARQVELAVATLDLTLAQYRVLGILGDGHEAASVLADKLAVSRPSITGVVDGLVARGLVRREPVGADRRRIDIGLTDEGQLVLSAADLEVQRKLAEIATHLADGPRPAFAALEIWSEALLNRTRAGICEGPRKPQSSSSHTSPQTTLAQQAEATL